MAIATAQDAKPVPDRKEVYKTIIGCRLLGKSMFFRPIYKTVFRFF